MASSDGRGWSELPHDLLSLILNRIPDVRDCIRLRATCKSYYSPPDAHTILNRKFLGSSNGWLVIADSSADLHIVDPRTGAHLPLPPTSTLSNIENVKRNADGQIIGYTTKHRSPDNGDGQIIDSLFHSVGYFWDDYCRVVRIFPSSFSYVTAFVAHGEGRLSMAKPGDGSWTKIKCHGISTIADVLQHNGLFYVMSMWMSKQAVALLDIAVCPPAVVSVCTTAGWSIGSVRRNNREYYLAESCDGDDLVLVCRYSSRANGETVNFQAARLRLISSDDGSCDSILLERVGQGPGLFMFRHYNRMMLAPTNDLLPVGLRENCIFFIDNDDNNSDVGIFGLDDRGGRPSFRASGSMGREVGKIFSSYLCDGRPPVWVPAYT